MTPPIVDFPDKQRIEEEAAGWIARLDAGRLTRDDLASLRAWSALSPRHRETLETMASLWDGLGVLGLLDVVEEPRRRGQPRAWILTVAAAAAVVAGIAVWFSLAGWDGLEDLPANRSYVTTLGEQRSLPLPDGSRFSLNTDSRLRVAYSTAARTVHLDQGEAYFEVAEDQHRPFEVVTRRGVVTAVGTAFSVRVDPRQSVHVLVSDGQVQLEDAAHKGTARQLRAGQRALLDEIIGPVETLEVREVERHLSWRDGVLMFAGEPLAAVVAEINRYSHTSIVIADPELEGLRFGGYFRTGDTEAVLNTLQADFGIEVERGQGGAVLLKQPNRSLR